MSRLSETDAAISLHRQAQLEMHVVHHDGIEQLWGAWDAIRIALFQAQVDSEIISEIKRPIFRLRRVVTGLPLPFNHRDLPVEEIQRQVAQHLDSGNYEIVKQHLQRVLAIAETLLAEPANPIAPLIAKIARTNAHIVIGDSFYRVSVGEWSAKEFPELGLQVITKSELPHLGIATQLIFLGSPFFISFRQMNEPDWRFARDPKAKHSHFIMYPFGDSSYDINGLLPGKSPMRRISSSVQFTTSEYGDDTDEVTEWSSREQQTSERLSRDTDAKVRARYVGLAGGIAIYLEDDDDSQVFSVVRDTEGKLDIQKFPLTELKVGGYIVLRTEGASSDLIQSLADDLGAKKHRPNQQLWKDLLRSKVREHGLTHVRQRLKHDFGLTTSNLADWVYNPRRISPQLESDFVAVCKFLEIEDQAPTLWKSLKRIRALHVEAGRNALATLRESIEEVDADNPELRKTGTLTLSAKGLGEIGVYRVEHIGNSTLVNGDMIQVPIIVEGCEA